MGYFKGNNVDLLFYYIKTHWLIWNTGMFTKKRNISKTYFSPWHTKTSVLLTTNFPEYVPPFSVTSFSSRFLSVPFVKPVAHMTRF